MMSSFRKSCISLLIGCLFVAQNVVEANAANTKTDWASDLDYLSEEIFKRHPDPDYAFSADRWDASAKDLKKRMRGMSDTEVVIELARLIARLEDGHTNLDQHEKYGFDQWFPIRFYWFDDGLFITTAHETTGVKVGSRIERVGGKDWRAVAETASSLMGAENEFRMREMAPIYLASVPVMEALGFVEPGAPLELDIVSPSGEQKKISVDRTKSFYSSNFRFWGETFGPPHDDFDTYNTVMENRAPLAYRDYAAEAPPYLASREPYWFRRDDAANIVFMQFNFAAEVGGERWDDFRSRLWADIDNKAPTKFIIDIRYNFGGDGSMVQPFIKELLARPSLTKDGKLFVITGRQTFSAGIMMAAALRNNTAAVFVGEPAGAPFNHYGDPVSVQLPNSTLNLNISTLYWQLAHPSDHRKIIPIDIPVSNRAADYFNMIDAFYDAAVTAPSQWSLLEIFKTDGAEKALAEYDARKTKYGAFSFWRVMPDDSDKISKTISALSDAGKTTDALALAVLWTEIYQKSINAWLTVADMTSETDKDLHRHAVISAAKIDPERADVKEAIEALSTSGQD